MKVLVFYGIDSNKVGIEKAPFCLYFSAIPIG